MCVRDNTNTVNTRLKNYNGTELRLMHLNKFGCSVDPAVERSKLIRALETDKPITTENTVDVKRNQLINFIAEYYNDIKTQLKCSGFCVNCTDGQVLHCWLSNQNYLEDRMTKEQPKVFKNVEDVLSLQEYEEAGVFSDVSWMARAGLLHGLIAGDDIPKLVASAGKKAELIKEIKELVIKLNKEKTGDTEEEADTEEEESDEEEKQEETPPKKKRGRPPKAKTKVKTKTKSETKSPKVDKKEEVKPDIDLTFIKEKIDTMNDLAAGMSNSVNHVRVQYNKITEKLNDLTSMVQLLGIVLAPELAIEKTSPFHVEDTEDE